MKSSLILNSTDPNGKKLQKTFSDVSSEATPATLKQFGQKLNAFLKEKSIQYKCDGGWVLYARYAGKGYTKYITYVRKCDGVEKVRMEPNFLSQTNGLQKPLKMAQSLF